ncbi:MAG: hypothetical protein ACOX44_01330 [Limnochordia bacterium]
MRTLWLRLLLCIIIPAFLTGVCAELGIVRLPPVSVPPILQTLHKRLDWTVLVTSIRGLGSFNSRLDWADVFKRLIVPAPSASRPLRLRMQ